MTKNLILKLSAAIVAIFGLLSLFMTGSIIFDLFNIRVAEGNYIPFIVYTNFICSFIYLFAAYGFLVQNRLTTGSLFIAGALLIIAYIGLVFYINYGGSYETKTVKAMLFRIAVTTLLAGVSWYYITRTNLLSAPCTNR